MKKSVMIFDVETTGLIQKQKKGPGESIPIPLEKQPHILQISFLIYDEIERRTTKSVDLYINVADTVVISDFITEKTGITRQMCNERGIGIENALFEFYSEYIKCDRIVAHNLDFDREMIQIEMQRNGNTLEKMGCLYWNKVFDKEFEKMQHIHTFCTMRIGRNVCKLECANANGKYYKNPKLEELYKHFFGVVPENLHNSLVDTYVCLCCYLKLREPTVPLRSLP